MNNQSLHINELAAALSKAQGEMTAAVKENLNPHFKSKYADLNSVWNACRVPLSKHGLAVTQTMGEENGKLFLYTILMHTSDQWIRSAVPILNERGNAQGMGSAITYARRYSLSAIVGVAPDEDDDGNAASKVAEPSKTSRISQVEKKPTISPEQALELNDILAECNPEYVKQLWNTLNGSKITTLEQITLEIYPRLKAAAIKRRDEAMALKEDFEEVKAS